MPYSYEVDIEIGGSHFETTEVEARSVSEAAGIAAREVSDDAQVQDPRHPLPEVCNGEATVVGSLMITVDAPRSRPVRRELIE